MAAEIPPEHDLPPHEPEPRFSLGQIVATPGALETLEAVGQDPLELLKRHVSGDWGDLVDEDKEENELSLKEGYRLLSAYVLANEIKVWIITEADCPIQVI